MNVSEMRPPPGGFEDRLEADLVKVVTARAALPQRPRQRAAAAMRRPAVRAGVLAVGTAVAAAASFAFGGPSLSHRQAAPPQAGLSTSAGPVHIRTAAFSLDTYTDGTVHVTWDKSQYIRSSQDIAGLQQALREAGFPVLIKEGVFCKGPHDNGHLGPGGVGPGVGQVMKGEGQPDGTVVFTFTPSAMPAGEELFIGYLSPSQLAITHGQPGSVERLVPTGVPLTCSTQAPLPHYRQSQPVEQPG
ncbi:MAG: hypothetical protein JWM19_4327 [Actinomycetia bacterium]|nr:hypothetical protein [Actinomycetes bacterium]